MKKFFHHMFVTLLLAFVILLCACSVNERREEDSFEADALETDSLDGEEDVAQMEVDFDEPIRIFYMDRDAGLLTNFAALYPEIELERCPIYPNFEGKDLDIAYWAEKWGDPDIVLLSDPGYWDIETEYENGQVEDIREYCAADETLDVSNYVGGTFEVFDNGEAMLGLPLSWYKRCLVVKESQLAGSELESLPEDYTGRDLFEAMLAEIKKEKYEEKFCLLHGLGFSDNLTELAPKVDGKFQMDEEMFKTIFEYSVLDELNYDAAREAFGNFSEHANQRLVEPALDPEFCPDGYFGTCMRGAPQMMAIYAKSVAAMDQDDVKLFWVPTIDNNEEYVGLVKDYAFIGKNSTRKQQAYEVIRMLMDMPITLMTQPNGLGSEIYSPVNIQSSLDSLEYFNSLEQELIIRHVDGEIFYKLDQQKLSEEELEDIRGIITGMVDLYAKYSLEKNNELSMSYYDYRTLAIETGKIDHTMCYAEMQKYLHSDDEAKTAEDIDDNSENAEESFIKSEVLDEITQDAHETDEVANLKEKIRETETGEIFLMGAVEQDNDLNNGADSIEWIILEKTDDKVFVISKKALEYLPFASWESKGAVNGVPEKWINSYFIWSDEKKYNPQRTWLIQEIYENGLTDSEKSLVVQKNNATPWMPLGIYNEVAYTKDYLYIPSVEEIETYKNDVGLMQCEMTEYVKTKAMQLNSRGNYVSWSLRSMGAGENYSKQINVDGELGEFYCNVPNGVRPVMWLDIG